MFTKNFYRRLWRHWITPTPGSLKIFPSAMYGMPANENPFITTQIDVNGSAGAGISYDNIGCGNGGVSTSITTSGAILGQYVPSSGLVAEEAYANYCLKRLTLTETAYNENTFYDRITANTPIANLSFSARTSQSDSNVVYDSTTDSIKKTYSYTITNNNANSVTVRALSGTMFVNTRRTENGTNVPSYLLVWAINLDNPVEILTGESATLTITYRWNNCTPGSQASPYSISASIE